MTETEARMILIQIAQELNEAMAEQAPEPVLERYRQWIEMAKAEIQRAEYATLQREHAALLAEKGGEVAIAEALESPSPAEKVQP